MARRVLLREHPAQPSSALSINWGHPLSRGLIAAFVPGVRFNLVDGVGLVSVGTPVLDAGPVGIEMATDGIGYPEPASASDPLAKLDVNVGTALTFARQTTATNLGYCFGRFNGSSAPSWAVGLHGGSFNGPTAQWGTYQFTPSSTTATTTRPNVAAVTGDGTTARVYINGRQVASGAYTAATTQYSPGSQRQVWLGPRNGLASNTLTRPVVGLLWNRALTDSEIAQISANPWQLFQPQRKSMVWAAGGNVSVSLTGIALTASVGTLTPATSRALTGNASTVSAGTLSPSVTLGLGGNALTAAAGSVAAALSVGLTGNASTVSVGTVSPSGASNVTVALTGVSASVSVGTLAPVLSLPLSGNASTVSAGSLTPGVSAGISGVSAASAVGSVGVTRGVVLTNVSMSAIAGALTAVGGVTRSLQKGLRKTRYVPGRVPSEPRDMPRFLQAELERLTDGLESPFNHQTLEKLSVEPQKKPQGKALIAYADGVSWNPGGTGEGIYAYYSGSWKKL